MLWSWRVCNLVEDNLYNDYLVEDNLNNDYLVEDNLNNDYLMEDNLSRVIGCEISIIARFYPPYLPIHKELTLQLFNIIIIYYLLSI